LVPDLYLLVSNFFPQKPNGQRELDEVVETRDGDLKLPIRINGRELAPKQKQESG